MPEAGYEFFEHTADIGLRARGPTREALFIHAAQGLTELLVEQSVIAAQETRDVTLRAESLEALFVAWLKELLFWFMTDRFVASQYALTVEDTQATGRVQGGRFDPSRHSCGTEVKGVTYHQLRVQQTPHGWEAAVILDV